MKFGCARIDNSIFLAAEQFLSGYLDSPKGNRFVKGVQIGEGFFTNDDIKAIAERLWTQ